jgi:hypothetical protein
MRKELAKEEGQRKRFRAVFRRFGKKVNYKGYSEETVLFRHVVDLETNKVVTDHLWFSLTKGFEKLNLSEGMQVEFDARVKSYTKGYVNTRYKIDKSKEDYKLSNPTRIVRYHQND